MDNKFCKNCKFRLGNTGDEKEIEHCKLGINVMSNCEKFHMFGTFLVDPYILSNTHGVRVKLNDDFGCCLFEQKVETGCNDEHVAGEETKNYKDFTEPSPSPYDVDESEGSTITSSDDEVPWW